MSTLSTTVASLGDIQLTVEDLLRWLRSRGRLVPLVREALADRVVQDMARQANLSIGTDELQAAADAFRHRRGLNTASDTLGWLAAQEMLVDEFEAGLESFLLLSKVRKQVLASEVEARFAGEQPNYDRLRLAELCLGREDLARELGSQIRDDGRDVDAVAAAEGVPVKRAEYYLKDLAAPLAQALASAAPGQLVGPVATPQGFVLVLVEERQPAALDSSTRLHIENELFDGMLATRLKNMTFHWRPGEQAR